MTRLDVDELKANLASQPGGAGERVDKSIDLGVAEDHRPIIGIDPEAGIQEWMVICDARPRPVGPAKPPGMSQLQAHPQIAGIADVPPVRARRWSRSIARPARLEPMASIWFGFALPSGTTAAASPPQISLAPLRPKFSQRRSISGEGEPSGLASQPSIG